ncbi:MAG: class I SAM-dependent methyltransferase [bacterium]
MSETLSEAERQLLITAYELGRRQRPATDERLAKMGAGLFDEKLVDWEGASDSLVKRDLLQREDQVFSLTPSGWELAEKLDKEYFSTEFSQTLVRSVKSATYGRFCEIVYGKDLCQYNLSDMEQLDKLLELLALTSESKVLDLGCGPGKISEYISDTTYARVTGLDYATEAIELAQKRTRAKRDRLSYQVGDIDKLHFPEQSFDAIIAIDTLYFIGSLDQTMADLHRLLKPHGQLGIFHSQLLRPDQPKELLQVENTELAMALSKAGFSFKTVAFSEHEARLWQHERKAAEKLRSDFEAEGNLELCTSRIDEAERMMKMYASHCVARYLYHAIKP